MNRELIQMVLPEMARRLHREVKRYRAGKLSDKQFARKFESLMEGQFEALEEQGVPPAHAAVAVHGAVLVLTGPGLRAEAEELELPLEVVEYRAVRTAAEDIARSHGVSELKAFRQLAAIIAQYGD